MKIFDISDNLGPFPVPYHHQNLMGNRFYQKKQRSEEKIKKDQIFFPQGTQTCENCGENGLSEKSQFSNE